MRIACVGKGGSGKTTVSSLLLRHALQQNIATLAIDADINQQLADAAQIDVQNSPEVGNHLNMLKTRLIGSNTRIPSAAKMLKTTLPSEGSHFITLQPRDSVLKNFATRCKSAWFIRIGGFKEEDLGQKCYHAKTGGAELILNHLIDKPEELVLIDMTAGADAFASGLFSRFDLTLIVVEPTVKSVQVYKQYKSYAEDYGITIKAVGNKVEDEEDLSFLEDHCADDFIGYLTRSAWIKSTERGKAPDFSELEPHNAVLLQHIIETAQAIPRDWHKYWQWGIHFHNLNATGWGNASIGADATTQIDREFFKNFSPEPIWQKAENQNS